MKSQDWLDSKAQSTMILKLKSIWNSGTIDVTNNFLETVIFHLKEMLGILYFEIDRILQNKTRSFTTEFE